MVPQQGFVGACVHVHTFVRPKAAARASAFFPPIRQNVLQQMVDAGRFFGFVNEPRVDGTFYVDDGVRRRLQDDPVTCDVVDVWSVDPFSCRHLLFLRYVLKKNVVILKVAESFLFAV
jgi:hypothetical protein